MNLRNSIISASAAAVIISGSAVAISANANGLPPCIHEDGSGQESTGCYWDAQTMGNGLGTDISYSPTYSVPVVTDAYAWQMFDATNASALLPYDGARVTYYGSNTVGWVLDSTTIQVADDFGNYMLFLIG